MTTPTTYLVNLLSSKLDINEITGPIAAGGHKALRVGQELELHIIQAVERGWAKFTNEIPTGTVESKPVEITITPPNGGMSEEELKAMLAETKDTSPKTVVEHIGGTPEAPAAALVAEVPSAEVVASETQPDTDAPIVVDQVDTPDVTPDVTPAKQTKSKKVAATATDTTSE